MITLQNLLSNAWIITCIVFAIRDIVWKWFAMYKAWQRSQWWRFVCMFIFNTCGILPIVYLILNRKK